MTLSRTAGNWQHIPPPVYFHSAMQNQLRRPKANTPLLFAPTLLSANYWGKPGSPSDLLARKWIQAGVPLLFDSGIFTVINANQKAGLNAINTPEDHPALKKLMHSLDLLYGNVWWQQHAWGFVEHDLGTSKQRTRRREKLEDRWNMAMIPVFHFRFDSWQYLHWLVDRYDRVCLSFSADFQTLDRSQIFTEVNNRFEDAEVWFHHLAGRPGLNYTLTWEPHSMDSSVWLNLLLRHKPLNVQLADTGELGLPTLRGLHRPQPPPGRQLDAPSKGFAQQIGLGLLVDECRAQNLQHLHTTQKQIGTPQINWRDN